MHAVRPATRSPSAHPNSHHSRLPIRHPAPCSRPPSSQPNPCRFLGRLPLCLPLQLQCYCEKTWYGTVRCRIFDAQEYALPVTWWATLVLCCIVLCCIALHDTVLYGSVDVEKDTQGS